jgi:hypothetical protein
MWNVQVLSSFLLLLFQYLQTNLFLKRQSFLKDKILIIYIFLANVAIKTCWCKIVQLWIVGRFALLWPSRTVKVLIHSEEACFDWCPLKWLCIRPENITCLLESVIDTNNKRIRKKSCLFVVLNNEHWTVKIAEWRPYFSGLSNQMPRFLFTHCWMGSVVALKLSQGGCLFESRFFCFYVDMNYQSKTFSWRNTSLASILMELVLSNLIVGWK